MKNALSIPPSGRRLLNYVHGIRVMREIFVYDRALQFIFHITITIIAIHAIIFGSAHSNAHTHRHTDTLAQAQTRALPFANEHIQTSTIKIKLHIEITDEP